MVAGTSAVWAPTMGRPTEKAGAVGYPPGRCHVSHHSRASRRISRTVLRKQYVARASESASRRITTRPAYPGSLGAATISTSVTAMVSVMGA